MFLLSLLKLINKQKKVLLIRFKLLLIGLLFLNACSGNKALESRFAPDPNLKENSQTVNASQNNNPNLTPTENKLPPDFPADISIYSQAKLIKTEPNKITWQSSDPINLISNFYQQQLKAKNWIISDLQETSFLATNSNTNQQVKFNFLLSSGNTEFSIEYQLQPSKNSNNPETLPTNPTTEIPKPEITTNKPKTPELSNYLQDLINLNIITKDNQTLDPNHIVTRREYARWLVNVNNIFNADFPSLQIRLASPTTSPIFTDVNSQDADFAVIQGLAEAGLIPSSLTNDSNAINFKPDAPLTREDLISWKVPLDIRKALPTASLDTIKETWGFQDATKISPQVWRSLYSDWQNGDKANVRRAFGYTTLFQPKKPVTLAEASAVLWYFGDQNDGKSAQEVLTIKNSN